MEFYVNHDYLCRGYDYSDRRSDHLGSTYCTYWDEYTQGMDVSGENMIKFYKNEVMSLTQEYQFCGIWQIHQAASVLGHPIYSIYPHCPVYSVRDDHNRVVLPRRTIENETVYLMWTQSSMESNGFNHFVPVVKRSSAYELVESNVQQMLGLANKKKNKQTVCHIDLIAVDDNDSYICKDAIGENLEFKAMKFINKVNVCNKQVIDISHSYNEGIHCDYIKSNIEVSESSDVDEKISCDGTEGHKEVYDSSDVDNDRSVHDVESEELGNCSDKEDGSVWEITFDVDNKCKSVPEKMCTCCHRWSKELKIFKIEHFDMDDSVVKECLSLDNRVSHGGIVYICRTCNMNLKWNKCKKPWVPKWAVINKVLCTCCHDKFYPGRVKVFNECSYTSFCVSLFDRAVSKNGQEFICLHCHMTLTMQSKSMKARNEFSKKCKQFPEYACTCCHCVMFYKSVQIFHLEKYDLTNEDVEETLSRRYRYKSDDKEHEYICQTSHQNLKAGCMPTQAVANQLEVPVVPDILQNLTCLEGCCIALRIPFMSIRPMRKGGLGKITGPCINVPASLEPITEVLPRIPEETKLVVVKLKRMLMYKSHYLCDYIHPQIVMNALRWLKVNNPHYDNVKIDDQWPDKLEHDRLYKTINDQDDSENSDEDYLDEEEDTDLKDGYCEDRNMNDEVDGEACESEESDSEDEKTDEELEEANLKEDQLELDRLATVTVEGPSTCIQIYDLEEAVFSIAPGQNSIPKFILMDEDFEHLAFPNYFPCGVGGYDVLEPRKKKLDLRRYINQRLLNVKGHFSQDMDYIFAFQYATELQQLKSEMKIALKKTTGRTPVGHINAGNMKNFDFINNLVKHDYAYKFMNNVRGTPAYWQQQLLDTLAMMQKFSTPTWFLTLSPAEFLWVEFIQAIGKRYGLSFTEEDVANMEWETKARYLQTNPITTNLMFQHRVECFFNDFLMNTEAPLGNISEYCIKIEFQARGSPHAHCLLWVKDAPVIGDGQDDEKVCHFIEKYVHGSIPEDRRELRESRDLVMKLQSFSFIILSTSW